MNQQQRLQLAQKAEEIAIKERAEAGGKVAGVETTAANLASLGVRQLFRFVCLVTIEHFYHQLAAGAVDEDAEGRSARDNMRQHATKIIIT